MKKIRILSLIFIIFLICIPPFKQVNFSIKLEGNLKQSSPTDIILSTSSSTPTTVQEGIYYRTDQSTTVYFQITLLAGEIYIIATYHHQEVYLYFDSAYSNEIQYTDDQHIIYAPSTTKTYYVQWASTRSASTIGIWKAVKYNTSAIINGIDITFNDDDWAYGVIYFISPGPTIDSFETPDYFADYIIINEYSDEAYNSNHLNTWLSNFDEDLNNNPEVGFLMIFGQEGLFKISLIQLSILGGLPWDILLPILIIIGSIVGLISFITINKKYWKIGHRIQKRRREKKEARQIKKQQITDYSKVGRRIDEVVDGWQKSGKKESK